MYQRPGRVDRHPSIHQARVTGSLPGLCPGTRKRRYPTKSAAKAAVRRVIVQGFERIDPRPDPIGVYLCPCCDCWHVGHSSMNGYRSDGGGGT